MDGLLSGRRNRLFLVQLGRNEPKPVKARRGTAVCCLVGELWVTHEGDSQDYIVPKGYRYCSSEDGLIVVNSLVGSSTALVYWTDPQGCPDFFDNGVHVDFDSMQRLQWEAKVLRQKTMERLARKLLRTICSAWRMAMNRWFKAGHT